MYGEAYTIAKEECVGHVQKRIGRALREFKRKMKGKNLEDNRPVGGRDRLTDVIIDCIQNYYGQAIRNNMNNIESMKKRLGHFLPYGRKQ